MKAQGTKKLSLKEKLEIVSKDFLDRDGEHYTSARKEGRLDWEKMIGNGGAYSEFILHPSSQEELIKNAYNIATDMITVMDAPFKVKVNITGNQSCTDSKNLYVGTKVFDDTELTIGQKLDTFIGFTVHEGCHLLYTDLKAIPKSKLNHTLRNIIEDERIERVCGESKPGLVNFLKAAKYYSFDKYAGEIRAKGGFDNLDTFKRLLNAILAYIRYPKTLDSEDTKEFVDILIQVKDILTPYPADNSEVAAASDKIEELIKDYLKNSSKQNNNNGSSSESKNKSEDNETNQLNNSQSENNTSESEGNNNSGSSPDNSSDNQNDSSSDIKSESSDLSEKNDENSFSDNLSGQKSDSDIKKEIDAAMSDMESALDKIISDPKNQLNDDEKAGIISEDGGRVGRVCSGDLERGLLKNSYIHKGLSDEAQYKTAFEEIKKYIPAISRVLRMSSTEYKLSLKGMRSGILDTGKLAEAYQGVPTVYMKQGEVKTDKVTVCILIDESGSMWGDGKTKARETAILLNESLNKLGNVDLYIYGHTTSRSATDLYVYREKGFNCKYALGSTDARAGNHDSIAIKEACARVRKFSKNKCLFFMISDGAPNEPPELVRKAVMEVEKDNFSVVAISIDPYYDPSTMYSKNVTLEDMNTLAIEIGKMVKKAVMDNTKKKINL